MGQLIVEKESYKKQILSGSLFYTLSPIIIHNHFLNPLIPIWLIGLIPAVCYFFLKYLKTAKLKFILLAVIVITVFSFGAHNIPWEAGFLMPVVASILIGTFLYKRKDVFIFIRRLAIFCIIILLSQSFWLVGFIMTFINPSVNNFTAKAVSTDVVSNFANSVRATSTGTIIYPLLNLFHRQIAFDFQWNLKNIFTSFYDKTYILSSIYVIILFLGIMNFKKNTNKKEGKIFIMLLISFVISIYLFTVNIGPLLDLYILLGNIPGFVLFRNPFDKFALGYALIYSLLISYCLIILHRKLKNSIKYKLIFITFLLAVIIGAIPTKQIIVSPLWTTNNIYKNIVIPQEYLSIMNDIKNEVSPTNNILSLPYGLAQYTVIKDIDSNNVYAGISPVIIFSGVNDISGFLSFNYAPEAKLVDNAIIRRDYDSLNKILYTHNINYVFLTKNIPEDVRKSYLYVPEVLKAQDKTFVRGIAGKKVLTSSNVNFELYTAKKKNALISSKNLYFKRISRVKYKIMIKNLKGKQELLFNDTFHEGWNLYLQPDTDTFICENPQTIKDLKTTECKYDSKFLQIDDFNYIWRDPIFGSSHTINNGFSNKWVVDSDYIKKNFDKKMYSINKDGTLDVEMILYFKPQVYFYIGSAISILVLLVLSFLILLKRK
jgi:hypothetical protein